MNKIKKKLYPYKYGGQIGPLKKYCVYKNKDIILPRLKHSSQFSKSKKRR